MSPPIADGNKLLTKNPMHEIRNKWPKRNDRSCNRRAADHFAALMSNDVGYRSAAAATSGQLTLWSWTASSDHSSCDSSSTSSPMPTHALIDFATRLAIVARLIAVS